MPAPRRPAATPRTLATLAAACVVLTACSSVLPQPFIDMRREAGTMTTVGSSTLDRPAVCYNTMNATAADVRALADAVCAETGRRAVYESSDVARCTVLQPHRSFFNCVDTDQAPDPAGRRVTGIEAGPLGVRVPGDDTTPDREPAEGEDPGVPDLPEAPQRPPSPGSGGLLGIFD